MRCITLTRQRHELCTNLDKVQTWRELKFMGICNAGCGGSFKHLKSVVRALVNVNTTQHMQYGRPWEKYKRDSCHWMWVGVCSNIWKPLYAPENVSKTQSRPRLLGILVITSCRNCNMVKSWSALVENLNATEQYVVIQKRMPVQFQRTQHAMSCGHERV